MTDEQKIEAGRKVFGLRKPQPFKVSGADRKAITEEGRRVARANMVRLEIQRRFVRLAEGNDCISTFNISNVLENVDMDDVCSSRYTFDELAKIDDDSGLNELRVILDILVAKRVGFGAYAEWEPEDYIHPIFVDGKLVGFGDGR